jgi:prepilin-type N-terminal cleavage/methylation domain-containing protein
MKARTHQRGYILLEMIIALAIFAIAVLGLAKALNNTLQVANTLNREASVMLAMRSFLEETRRKPISDMASTAQDERLGITLTSEVMPEEVKTAKGEPVTDVYKLTVKASYLAQGKPTDDSLHVLVYQTQDEQKKRKAR